MTSMAFAQADRQMLIQGLAEAHIELVQLATSHMATRSDRTIQREQKKKKTRLHDRSRRKCSCLVID